MISSHLQTFASYPVEYFNPSLGITNSTHIYRIACDWDETNWEEKFNTFLNDPQSADARGLVIGAWDEMYDNDSDFIIELLVNAAPRLPNLHTLFLGDVTSEENEISWINQSNVNALFTAYPALTHFGVRGGNGLRFGRIDSQNLTYLLVEAGGIQHEAVSDILRSNLPNLTHLELYIGTDEYGRTVEVEHLAPLLDGTRYPKLRYLGLRDAQIADDIAAVFANAPIVDQLDTLDLSLGTLSDVGGRALLNSSRIRSLKTLDLHHHYLSDDMMAQIQAAQPSGILDDQMDDEEDGWRFVAVGE